MKRRVLGVYMYNVFCYYVMYSHCAHTLAKRGQNNYDKYIISICVKKKLCNIFSYIVQKKSYRQAYDMGEKVKVVYFSSVSHRICMYREFS